MSTGLLVVGVIIFLVTSGTEQRPGFPRKGRKHYSREVQTSRSQNKLGVVNREAISKDKFKIPSSSSGSKVKFNSPWSSSGSRDKFSSPWSSSGSRDKFSSPSSSSGSKDKFKSRWSTSGSKDKFKSRWSSSGSKDKFKSRLSTSGSKDKFKSPWQSSGSKKKFNLPWQKAKTGRENNDPSKKEGSAELIKKTAKTGRENNAPNKKEGSLEINKNTDNRKRVSCTLSRRRIRKALLNPRKLLQSLLNSRRLGPRMKNTRAKDPGYQECDGEGLEGKKFYRVLRPEEDITALQAKDPSETRSRNSHVLCGSRKGYKSQYISATLDKKVAEKWAKETRGKIAEFEIKDLPADTKITNLVDEYIRKRVLKGHRANAYARRSQEVLFELPPEKTIKASPCRKRNPGQA